MSQRRSSRLQQLDEGSSPAKNNEKNSNKLTPKHGKNNKNDKQTPSSKEKKSSTDEKNPRETAKNNRRKSDQKTNTTNTSTDKSVSETPLKRGQKRKAPSDENEGPKTKKQKTANNLSAEFDDVPFEESSSSQRRRSGKSVDEKVDEILDIRAEQWHQIDQFDLEASQNTSGDEKMVVYNSLTDADVTLPSSQQKLARTTTVNSKGKKVQFNAYSDLLKSGGDKDDLSFLTADDKNEYDEKEDKKEDEKEKYFRDLKARLAQMTEEEKKAEVRRLYYAALQRKAKRHGANHPMQSTPLVQNKAHKAPKTAPNLMRTNVLRNPTSPTKFNAAKDKKSKTTESGNNTNKKNDAQLDLAEENGSPKKSNTTTPNKPKTSATPKSAIKATPSKSKSTPAKTTAKSATKAATTAKNTPSKSKSTSTPNKAKNTPSKSNSATPSKTATASKRASPKKSANISAPKTTRARPRPTRFSL